jgi:hypothetical protein
VTGRPSSLEVFAERGAMRVVRRFAEGRFWL